ncbi:MAG: sigma-54-dependent Fis family transcriptional regulator, partial [Rhodoferax sp.]
MRPTPSEAELHQARLRLREHGECSPDRIDAGVARSWQRSLAAGLGPTDALRDTVHASATELQEILASNQQLLQHSRPVMEYLFEQVRESQSMVILADQRGTLVHTLGHTDFLSKAQQVSLATGASWLEQHRGTNAIGTALAEQASVEIHGAEHFLERNGFLTCAASPIVSARGELLGILDISGDQRNGHPHTLGLVHMAARMIENDLMVANSSRQTRLHMHARREGVGTVGEGILVLSGDGWIVGANGSAMGMLGLGLSDLNARQLAQVIDCTFNDLLASQRRNPGQPIALHTRAGKSLYGVLHGLQQRTWVAAPTPLARVAEDTLAQLDTGDLRWRNASNKVRMVLGKPIAVLIQGESGVGKELFARAAHNASPRAGRPFVAINCAAVPENLIEAELFGYAHGAFTGARRQGSPGRLREAHGGTLFLDEIGDMPLALQARLLRVLQEREVTPLGGGQPVAVDFALICASHRKLREEVERGRFRS